MGVILRTFGVSCLLRFMQSNCGIKVMCVLNFKVCVFWVFIVQDDISVQGPSYASMAGSHRMHFACIAIGLVCVSYFPNTDLSGEHDFMLQ